MQTVSRQIYEAILNIAKGRERNILYSINMVNRIDQKRASDGVVPSTENGRGSLINRSSDSIVANRQSDVKPGNDEYPTFSQLVQRQLIGDYSDVNPEAARPKQEDPYALRLPGPEDIEAEYEKYSAEEPDASISIANLTEEEYNRIITKKPIRTTSTEKGIIAKNRKSKYGGFGDGEIPVVDRFSIGFPNKVNEGYVYWIRNGGVDSFSVVSKKKIRPITSSVKEVYEDASGQHDGKADSPFVQSGNEPAGNRGNHFNIGDGEKLQFNDRGVGEKPRNERGSNQSQNFDDSGTVDKFSASEDTDAVDSLPTKAADAVKRTERGLVNAVGRLLNVPSLAKRDFLREIAVTISKQDKADIPDFADFRKRSFGLLLITNCKKSVH